MLTFLRKHEERAKDKHVKWVCRCDCGNEAVYLATLVRNGRRTSCANCSRNRTADLAKKHGLTKSSTHRSWVAMKTRCLNGRSKDYARYGAAGVTVCERWLDFSAFLDDMGERPEGTTLDRIDTTKGYSKENCRWASAIEQARNKTSCYRWTVKGIQFETMTEAAAHFGVTKQTICRWVTGYTDHRRGVHVNSKEGCRREQRY